MKKFFLTYRLEVGTFLLTLFFAFSFFYFSDSGFTNDDQFTLYRYIDNIALGKGFVFNQGERILGSTTPLFTVLAATAKFFFKEFDTRKIVVFINQILLSLSSVFFFKLSDKFLSINFKYLALVVYVLNLSKTISAGMETPMFILFMILFLKYLLEKKDYSASVYLSLTLLTRPDAGLIAVLAFVYWVYRYGFKKSINLTLVCIGVAMPWIIFSTFYFGSPIPQSFLTKLHINEIVNQSSMQAFKVQTANISKIYWGRVVDPNNIPIQVLINLVPVLFMLFLGFWKKMNKENWVLFLIPVLYFVSYSYSNPVMFAWYLSQIDPLWILISIIGLEAVWVYLVANIQNKNFAKFTLWAIFILILFGPVTYDAQMMMHRKESSKKSLYEMALYVKNNIKPGENVGLSNIGIVSYTLENNNIVDFIGITRRDTLVYYPVKDSCINPNSLYTIPPQMVMDKKTDWIIAGVDEWVPCFLEGEWFNSHYKNVFSIGTASVWKKVSDK